MSQLLGTYYLRQEAEGHLSLALCGNLGSLGILPWLDWLPKILYILLRTDRIPFAIP